jgi:DNA-binding FadR family transcriptional regulator
MTDHTLRPVRTNRVPLAVRALEYLLGLIESEVYDPGDPSLSEAKLTAQVGIPRLARRDVLRDPE